VFAEVRSAVCAIEGLVRDLDPARVDGRDAAALLEVFGQGERVCAAAKAVLARRVEETNVWRDGGHRSAAHWVAAATGDTVGAATRTLETARALEQLPETDAAFRAGGSRRSRQPRSRQARSRIPTRRPNCSTLPARRA
jgi:hypothetical protein